MKKIFFLLALLAGITASAQNMQITPISATHTASPEIKFKVGWTGARTYRHNIKVWVFVDYRKIENNAPAGNWTRAAVTATPAVSSTPVNTTATLVAGNDKGFWLNGADGDYSATLTVPLKLAAGVTQFSWCAYATDYPPNVVTQGNHSYTLYGSPPFVINGITLPAHQTTFSGTIASFTDTTGAPGLFPAALYHAPNGMGCMAGLVENPDGICIAPTGVGCSDKTLDLGTVSFTAGTEVEIVGNGISQTWSRPVTATGCQKTEYNGGVYNDYHVDCRNNTGYAGDLFSGCTLLRYAEKLCPPPWRMPDRSDYRNMVTALGGLNDASDQPVFVQSKLMGIWGAELNAWCSWDGSHFQKGLISSYAVLNIMSDYIVPQEKATGVFDIFSPQNTLDVWTGRNFAICVCQAYVCDGWAVRCIRN